MKKVKTLTPIVIKFLKVNGLDPKVVRVQLLRGEIEIERHTSMFAYIRKGGRDLKFPFILKKKVNNLQENNSNDWKEGIFAVERLKPHYHEKVSSSSNDDCSVPDTDKGAGNDRDLQ